jgi:hypothetical protein
MMSNVKEIEEAVVKLSATDLAAFREWFAKFDAEAWDRQIEDDVAAGRLDAFADEAIQDLQSGRCTEPVRRRDPKHPSLHFKKVGRCWSVRVGVH